MRAISLWQPWATAIAIGLKSIETRGWQISYRGPIAIHAAKRWGPDQRSFAEVEQWAGRLPENLPLGVIVATATITDCKPVERLRESIGAIERNYGNYDDGRFGWLLADVVALPRPIPFRGAQGIFNVPDELLGRFAQ